MLLDGAPHLIELMAEAKVFNFGSSPKELIQIKDSRIPGVQGSSEMT